MYPGTGIPGYDNRLSPPLIRSYRKPGNWLSGENKTPKLEERLLDVDLRDLRMGQGARRQESRASCLPEVSERSQVSAASVGGTGFP